MLINIKLLYNAEKDTYSVINLSRFNHSIIQRNAAYTLINVFGHAIVERFTTRTAINNYIKTLKETNNEKTSNNTKD